MPYEYSRHQHQRERTETTRACTVEFCRRSRLPSRSHTRVKACIILLLQIRLVLVLCCLIRLALTMLADVADSSLCVIRFVMSCLPSVSRPMFYEYVPSRAGTTRGLEEHRELSSAFPTLRR